MQAPSREHVHFLDRAGVSGQPSLNESGDGDDECQHVRGSHARRHLSNTSNGDDWLTLAISSVAGAARGTQLLKGLVPGS